MARSIFGRFRERAEQTLLADDLAPQLARIEIIGDKRVLVENHRGILEYGDRLMRINCGSMVVRIEGENLALRTLSLSELAVTGKITAVQYVT